MRIVSKYDFDTKSLRSGELIPENWVASVMQRVVPPNARINNESLEFMQQCVAEFITLINTEAVDTSRKDKRARIISEDIIQALTDMGFDNYVPFLNAYKTRYRELQQQHQIINDVDATPPPPPMPLHEEHHPTSGIGMPPPPPQVFIPVSPPTIYEELPHEVAVRMPPPPPQLQDETNSFVESVIRDSDDPW
ncbi:hypothetical protein QVD17_06085 [Tagetes erecta]|uniref:Transcription factor CBF/NF-Y/archaeal histone domain-containing protein n=1 Tax=Tagetes erecta TaxID=13708 RepID=A0AAD8LMT0_TARER|nr:hypothetical protein QVD17_06085 [Tagetes erecta]